MVRGAMAEGEGDGAPWSLGVKPGRPWVSRGSLAAMGEMGRHETFLS